MGEGGNTYWSKFVKDLAPYEPGEQPGDENVVKLNRMFHNASSFNQSLNKWNLQNVKTTDINHFSAFDIIKFKKVIFTETSVKELEKRYE